MRCQHGTCRAMGGNPGAGKDLALPSLDSPFQPQPGLLEAPPNGAEKQQNLCPTVLLEDLPADVEDNHSSYDHQGKGSLEVEVTGRNEVAQVGWRGTLGVRNIGAGGSQVHNSLGPTMRFISSQCPPLATLEDPIFV